MSISSYTSRPGNIQWDEALWRSGKSLDFVLERICVLVLGILNYLFPLQVPQIKYFLFIMIASSNSSSYLLQSDILVLHTLAYITTAIGTVFTICYQRLSHRLTFRYSASRPLTNEALPYEGGGSWMRDPSYSYIYLASSWIFHSAK